MIKSTNLHKTDIETWKTKISLAWEKSVSSVIEVGKLISSAKKSLGVSYSILETELPFSTTVAAYLVKIAEHPVLSNPQYFSMLPSGYNTLYHLASVDENKLIEQIESGEITPDYGLSNAKALRLEAPKYKLNPKHRQKISLKKYSVGIISVEEPTSIDGFQNELLVLLKKYGGEVRYVATKNSLYDYNLNLLHQKSIENIKIAEAELSTINLADLRILEDAAHYLSKPKSQSHKIQIVLNDEIVERTALPSTYKDFKRLCKILNSKVITRALLKNYVIQNKIPNQFTELSSMDKTLYVWEQVRLITEKKDVKGGLKRLKNLASHSTIPEIKELATENLRQLNRFSNRV